MHWIQMKYVPGFKVELLTYTSNRNVRFRLRKPNLFENLNPWRFADLRHRVYLWGIEGRTSEFRCTLQLRLRWTIVYIIFCFQNKIAGWSFCFTSSCKIYLKWWLPLQFLHLEVKYPLFQLTCDCLCSF